MENSQNPNSSNLNQEIDDTSANLANEFLESSNKLIEEALASCEIQGFTPVPLEIPEVIQQSDFRNAEPPDVRAFFRQAESVWKNMLNQTPENPMPDAATSHESAPQAEVDSNLSPLPETGNGLK